MSKNTYILDPGHGGIDPVTGQYVTAGKRSPKWSDGSVYFEGVGNRQIAKIVGDKLTALGINFVYTVTPSNWKDVGLTQRANIANTVRPKENAVLISIHSNAASDSSANGYEVFTTPGQTESDKCATIWFEEMGKEFPELKGRANLGDGDPDKEEVFTVIAKTNGRAFLVETMFHTNEKECKILMDKAGRERVANVIVRTIQRIEKA